MFEIETYPYTLADIIRMAGISERTARRHLSDGLLKGSKVGGTWRFTEENIRAYFNEKTMIESIAQEAGQDVRTFLKEEHGSDEGRICSIIDFRPENKQIEKEAKKAILDLSNDHKDISMKLVKKNGVMRFTLIGDFDYILECTRKLKAYKN